MYSPFLSIILQKSNCDEALELLKIALDSCKQLPLPLIMFYDELTEMVDYKTLHPTVMEWSVDFNLLRLQVVVLYLGKTNLHIAGLGNM